MVDRGSLDFNKNLAHIDDRVRAQAPVNRQTILPIDFRPSAYDVICARGKAAWNHIGNRRYRVTIDLFFGKYKAANSKVAKSLLVMQIVDIFRENSPRGGFVKQDNKTGRWLEVGDAIAREKVGQSLRELLLQENPERYQEKRHRKASLKKARRQSEKKHKAFPKASLVPGPGRPASEEKSKWAGPNSPCSSVSSIAFEDLVQSIPDAPQQQQRLTIDAIRRNHQSALSLIDLMHHQGVQHEFVPPVTAHIVGSETAAFGTNVSGRIVRDDHQKAVFVADSPNLAAKRISEPPTLQISHKRSVDIIDDKGSKEVGASCSFDESEAN